MKLSRNNQLVLDALQTSGRSMGAYDVIEAVREHGITAPPTVYRALGKLIELGIVHRIESSNTFVACSGGHGAEDTVMLLVCNECSRADEFTEPGIRGVIDTVARDRDFQTQATVLEVKGLCADCQSTG